MPRIPFVLLVLGLLGGGLVCLLVVNTTLGATSFRINQLQSDNAQLSLQEQTLVGQVADEQSPQRIAQRAYQLGMRPQPDASILDLPARRLDHLPGHPGANGLDSAIALAPGTSAGTHSTAHRSGVTRTGGKPRGRTGRQKRVARTGAANRAGTGR